MTTGDARKQADVRARKAVDDRIRELVAAAPPFTPEQREELAAILQPASGS